MLGFGGLFDDEWLKPFRMGRLDEGGKGDLEKIFGLKRGRGFSLPRMRWFEPAPRSSRPVMTSGETGGKPWHATSFHFRHDHLSVGGGGGGGASGGAGTSGDRGRAADFQRYIERLDEQDLDEEISAREGVERDENGAISFGDLGGAFSMGDKAGDTRRRAQIWDLIAHDVEKRANARFMNRIVAELPHEVGPVERRAIAEGFAERFREAGLPYWIAVHTPDVAEGSDPRNYHLHAVYHERRIRVVPATAGAYAGDGETEADASRAVEQALDAVSVPGSRLKPIQAANQNVVLVASPVRAEEPRRYGWIRDLREHYAAVASRIIRARQERESDATVSARLFDPRSYKAVGIDKTPGEHLGARASALERKGIPTAGGARNRRREVAFEVGQGRIDLTPQVAVRASLARMRAEGISIAPAEREAVELLARDPLCIDGAAVWENRRRTSFGVPDGSVGVERGIGWGEIAAHLAAIERRIAERRTKESEAARARAEARFAAATSERMAAIKILSERVGADLARRVLRLTELPDGDEAERIMAGGVPGPKVASLADVPNMIGPRERARLAPHRALVERTLAVEVAWVEAREAYVAAESRKVRLGQMAGDGADPQETERLLLSPMVTAWVREAPGLVSVLGLPPAATTPERPKKQKRDGMEI